MGGANKFINPGKMPMNTNYVHRMSGGMPIDASQRVNDILLESQKMIYAPPSREKTKQSIRSPMLEKGKAGSIGSQMAPAEEYNLASSGAPYQHGGNTAGGTRKKQGGGYQNSNMMVVGGGAKYQPNPNARG